MTKRAASMLCLALAACAPPPTHKEPAPSASRPAPLEAEPAAQPAPANQASAISEEAESEAAEPLPLFVTLAATPTAPFSLRIPRNELETGTDYDSNHVLTYGAQDGRVAVRRADGVFWADPAGLGPTKTALDFWTNTLAYVHSWDGQLFDAPGAHARLSPVFATAPRRELWQDEGAPPEGFASLEAPAEVQEIAVRQGDVWFKIGLLDVSPCDGVGVKVVDGGWVRQPAWPATPVISNYSKGC